MKRRDLMIGAAAVLWLISLLTASGCVDSAPVLQGKVVSVEMNTKIISVQDELHPTDAALAFNLSRAEMGTPPAVGDQVRLVYRTTGGQNMVLRIMNLTQQKERGKEQ